MAQFSTSRFSQPDPYQLYLDLDILNNNTSGTTVAQPCVINNTQQSSIIDNPSLYFLSVVRFSLLSTSLPVMLCQVDTTQSNPNLLVYAVTLSYLGNTSTKQVVFNPQDLRLSPPPILDQSAYSNLYYATYSYQPFLDMLNATIAQTVLALNDIVTLPTTIAPFVTYDASTALFSIYADKTGYDQVNRGADSIFLSFNAPLYTLFSTLPYITLQSGLKQLNIRDLIINNVTLELLFDTTYSGIFMTQDSTSTPCINPISSIVFISSQIPLVKELSNPPQILNSLGVTNVSSNNNQSTPIVTDFQVGLSNGNSYKNIIEYVPQAEYRLIDLIGTSPLNTVNLNVYWKDKYGTLHPFLLDSGCWATIKFMFRRKSFSGHSHAPLGPL